MPKKAVDKLKEFFGKSDDKWDWENFPTTENYPVSPNLIDWIVGQERAIEECKLCIDEWTNKLGWLNEKQWWKQFEVIEKRKETKLFGHHIMWHKGTTLEISPKSNPKDMLPAGPFLLMLGDAGTGKSLLGRAMQNYMTELYKEKGINLYDVCAWQNKANPSQPKISIHPSPQGVKIIEKAYKQEAKKGRFLKYGFNSLMGMLIGFGALILGYIGYNVISNWIMNPIISFPTEATVYLQQQYGNIINYAIQFIMANATLVSMGIMSMAMGGMLFIFSRFLGGMLGGKMKGIGNSENTKAPKLLIDNSSGFTPFIDATGHGSAQLFGSIAWDPYQQYSEDTYILTASSGWKFIKDVKKGERVITLNPFSDRIEIQPIEWTVSSDVNDKVISFKNEHFDLIVSKNHAIWNAVTKQRECAGNFIDKNVLFTRMASNSMEIELRRSDTFLKFIAWCITEGSSFMDGYHRRIKICQTNEVARVRQILDDLGEKYSYDGKDFRIHHASKELYNYVHALGKSTEKYIPEEIKNSSARQLRLFFDELMLGDGYKHEMYYTSSFRLASDVQEVALRLGYGTTLQIDKRKKWTKNFAYSISMAYNGIFSVEGKEIQYKGRMYCVGVPNGIVFVMRNGKPLWCGNTGGLGTPEHQRVTAGDIHRAHLGIFYIDEVKNLTGHEAITLLTVLEDGQLPIAMRESMSGSGTAAMAVATEPIPCMFFLIAAGNLDSLAMIHPALLDRIHGYGKTVYMSNDMPNTPENRRKYVQFISQEVKRFHLLPVSRDACIAIIEEAIRRSGKNNTITCKFRPIIGTIKTASILAQNEGLKVVERRHVEEALNEHCKSIALQVMEKHVENQIMYSVMVDPKANPKIGQIHGLAVSTINSEGNDMVGSVLSIRASCLQKEGPKKFGYFTVTGVRTSDSSYVQHSIAKVRHVILQLYGIDVQQDCYTHVDFAQDHNVEGPSAGVTMTLAIASVLLHKKIRQDVAVTGELNIGDTNGKIVITPIGGVHEKIMAAERMGFKKVCIPKRNFEKNINPYDYTIEVVGCETIKDYIREVFV